MAKDERFHQTSVLILAAEGARREALGKACRKEGFKPTFIGTAETLFDLLASVSPATLLHDWPTIDLSQAIMFHQKISKMSDFVRLCRVVYVEAVTPTLIGVASDTGIRRVISYGTNPANLVSEISMALSSMNNMPELQKVVQSAQAGAKYAQDDIDKQVEQAYHYYPHDPAVRLEFGQLCLRRKDIKTARMIADDLTQSQPGNVRAMNLLARILMAIGQVPEAIALLEKADVLSPLNIDRLLLLGDACFAAGANKKSEHYYEKALHLSDGSDAAARTGLARVKLSDGDVNAALEIIHDSMSEEEAASLFNNAAVLAAQSGRHGDSLRLYQSALQVVKSAKLKATICFNLALAHERMNNAEESAKYIKRSLHLDPDFDKARRHSQKLRKKQLKAAS